MRPARRHCAWKITSSPSSKYRRVSPFGSVNGLRPPVVISNRQPALPGSVPDNVPLPNRSPGWRLHPFDVWCATICATVQYSTSPEARDNRNGAAPASRIACVSNDTENAMSSAPFAWSSAPNRCGKGAGSPAGRDGWGPRNGASASP